MDNKNKNDDKKTNEDIRKEIEELEKLLKRVQEQNKDKINQVGGPNPIIRINLGTVYSRNFYVNLIISFLINFITMFVMVKIIGHLFITGINNDLYLLAIVFAFSLFEEYYKAYLLKKHLQIVLYSVGTIFFLLNILFFYLVDFLFFGSKLFISPFHPILYIIVFSFFRYIIKIAYKQVELIVSRKKKR